MSDYNLSVSHRQTRDELSQESPTRFIPKRFSDKLRLSTGPHFVETRDTTDDFIWDRDNWDEVDWSEDYTESPELISITNYNNEFRWKFDFDKVKGPNDTATWNTTTGVVTILAGELMEIVSAFYDSTDSLTVQSAILTATTTGTVVFTMSADGSNYESATAGTELVFANPGSDLRIRAISSEPSNFLTSASEQLETSDGDLFLLATPGTGTISELKVSYKLG
jgi:hypothetical protein